MRILQISKKIPYPQKDGESIAIANLASSLKSNELIIDLISLNTNKHYTDPELAKSKLEFYNTIEIIPHTLELSAVQALKHILQSNSYNIERFKSNTLSQSLIELLTKHVYDLIILETLYVAQYIEVIRQHSAAMIIMRAHNIEHHIWTEIAALEKQVIKKKYLQHLAQSLKEYELAQIKKYDAVLAVASDDYKWYSEHMLTSNLLLNPIGIDIKEYTDSTKRTGAAFSFGFIGALDWIPNVEGLNWFLEKVWLQVYQNCPAAEFHIAGRNMPQDYLKLQGNGIVVHGEVANAISFISSLDVMVAPLFVASGIRVKILEAMALGRIVVTSSTALKGNHATDKEHIILANTSEEFIAEMTNLYKDKTKGSHIGPAARQFVNTHFNQETLTSQLIEFINKLQDNKLRIS